jgi:hypothetical protein
MDIEYNKALELIAIPLRFSIGELRRYSYY